MTRKFTIYIQPLEISCLWAYVQTSVFHQEEPNLRGYLRAQASLSWRCPISQPLLPHTGTLIREPRGFLELQGQTLSPNVAAQKNRMGSFNNLEKLF